MVGPNNILNESFFLPYKCMIIIYRYMEKTSSPEQVDDLCHKLSRQITIPLSGFAVYPCLHFTVYGLPVIQPSSADILSALSISCGVQLSAVKIPSRHYFPITVLRSFFLANICKLDLTCWTLGLFHLRS